MVFSSVKAVNDAIQVGGVVLRYDYGDGRQWTIRKARRRFGALEVQMMAAPRNWLYCDFRDLHLSSSKLLPATSMSTPAPSMFTGTGQRKDHFQIITDAIIASLDSGLIPWRKPWSSVTLPKSYMTRKPYRGINAFLLGIFGSSQTSYYLTLKQANGLGGRIKKGSKGHTVYFFKMQEKKESKPLPQNQKEFYPCLKTFTVFAATDVEGVDLMLPDEGPRFFHNPPIGRCEEILEKIRPQPVVVDANEAFYSPLSDSIGIPGIFEFDASEDYYNTLFHELGHWTGHRSRLNRPEITGDHAYGTPGYAREELVAEMTAALLCAETGIDQETLENTVAYCRGWSSILKANPKIVMEAAGRAQKAADFLLNTRFDDDDAPLARAEAVAADLLITA